MLSSHTLGALVRRDKSSWLQILGSRWVVEAEGELFWVLWLPHSGPFRGSSPAPEISRGLGEGLQSLALCRQCPPSPLPVP